MALQPTPAPSLPAAHTATQPPLPATVDLAAPTGTLSPPLTVTQSKPAAPTHALPSPTGTHTLAPPLGDGWYGIAQSNLELWGATRVSDLGATTTIALDVRNLGPSEFQGPLRVVCVGQGWLLAEPAKACSPVVVDTTVTLTQSVGTGHFNADLLMTSPACFYPGAKRSLIVPDGKDPNPANNHYGFALP
jgi:hypothetical protein